MKMILKRLILLWMIIGILIMPAFSAADDLPLDEEGQTEEEEEEEDDPEPPSEISVRISPNGSYTEQDGIYIMSPSDSGMISFTASANTAIDTFLFSVTDNGGAILATGATADGRFSLTASNYMTGNYGLRVEAIVGDEIKAAASLRFCAVQNSNNGNGRWGYRGGRRWGGFGGMSGENTEKIIAGKALTSTHAKGDYSNWLDNSLEFVVPEESSQYLQLGSQVLNFALNDGKNAFTASIEESCLLITPDDPVVRKDANWSVSLDTLEKLSLNGITELVIVLSDYPIAIPTMVKLQGYTYGRLRAQGYVSKDMLLVGSAQGKRLLVAENVYLLDEDGNLTLCDE